MDTDAPDAARNSSFLDRENLDQENGSYSFLLNDGFNLTSSTYEASICCLPGAEKIIIPLVFSVVVVLGCLGNSLVIVVVLKNRDQFTTTTNLFILNLAIADLLFLLFCVPFHAIIYTVADWPFGEFMCKFVHLIQYSSMVASILTLVSMSLDRYLAVAHPLHTKHLRTPRKALLLSVLIWFVSLGVAIPWPVFYTVRHYDQYGPEPVAVCADDWGTARYHRSTYFLFLFLFSYALPLLIIGVLGGLMVFNLWRARDLEGLAGEESTRSKKKVTKLVLSVIAVFFLCWLPSHVVWLWSNYSRHTWNRLTYPLYYTRITAHILSYANSAINPLIYAFLSENFRKGFCKALRCTGSRITPTLNGSSKAVYSLYNEEHPIMQSTDTTV